MNLDAYRLALSGTGKLKMRALSLLAEGTEATRFDAALLLHEVARAEQRALRSLERPSHEVCLGSAVERCWCLLEGLDLPAAANAYGDVLEASKNVPGTQADAMRERLDPRFKAMHTQYARAIEPLRLSSTGRARAGAPNDDGFETVLRKFPGTASLWFVRGIDAKAPRDAWGFVRRAARLEPDDARFLAGSVRLVAEVLAGTELDDFLKTTWVGLTPGTGTADVYLFLALAHMARAQDLAPARRGNDLRRAREACDEGASRSASCRAVELGLHPTLRAVRLAVDAMIAGSKPDERVLYEAGLGELVVAAPRGADVLKTLRRKANELAA